MRIKPSYKKNIIILLIWVLIFASAPLYMLYEEFIIDSEVDWQELTHIWSSEAGFLVIFLIVFIFLIERCIFLVEWRIIKDWLIFRRRHIYRLWFLYRFEV